MSKSILKNLTYNVIYQIVVLFIPLITTPYISRVLGRNGIGIYGYTLSIVQYFIILGTLGIDMYGNREIAYVRDDNEKISKTFWTICCLKLITTSISLILFIVFVSLNKNYKEIYIIQSINIIAAMLDISWLFIGLEDFKKVVTRNIIIKIVGVLFIFIFIKSSNDLNKYITINVLMIFIGNLIMWVYIPKGIQKIKICYKDIKIHLVKVIQLFIPQVAIQIYVVLDKTMLGLLSTVSDVGLYEQSQKLIKLALALVTSLGVVMLPRMSNIFASGNFKKMSEYLNNSLKFVLYLSIPMSVGLAGISDKFVPWFFGEEFSAVSLLITVQMPILILIAVSNVLGTQYLLPSNRIKEFTKSVIFGAIINLFLNLILIPKYKALGACISSVFAELVVTYIQYNCLKKNINSKVISINIIKYVIASIIMLIVIKYIGFNMKIGIITNIIQIICAIIVYFLSLIILKEEINSILIKVIKNRINKFLLKNIKD